MFTRVSCVLAAAGLLAVVPIAAQSQQNNPSGNLGSNRSATGTTGTADSPALSGTPSSDAGSRGAAMGNYNRSSGVPTQPGATGRTAVPGNNSTVAGDMPATGQNKTSSTEAGQTGGGSR